MKPCKFIYVVVRQSIDKTTQKCYNAVLIDSFRTYEAAQASADAAHQTFIDAGVEDLFKFDVLVSTYYDE